MNIREVPADVAPPGAQVEGPAVADLSERGKLRFTGPQRAWFLHQIFTQSFEDLAAGESRETAMITAHGRLIGYGEAVATEDAILVHFDPSLRPSWQEHIERYVFATQVEIADVTDAYGLVLVIGEAALSAVDDRDVVAVQDAPRFGGASYLWVQRAAVPNVLDRLQRAGAASLDEGSFDALRIGAGVPMWARDMDGKSLPQEAGISQSAVHYDKGCYLGQEAMAKIHFRGKVGRRLVVLRLSGAAGTGDEVTLEGDVVGRVTSSAEGAALAIVKTAAETGASVEVAGTAATIEREIW